ncbi:MAG: hypothetical protein KTR31_23350 [Myxococcales bacterium]|nr:hypothetical protein [Myxococcales bacterium]
MDRALRHGVERRMLERTEERLTLTRAGHGALLRMLGEDAEEKRERLLDRRFPAQALGLDPDDETTRDLVMDPVHLSAAIVAVGFGLPPALRLSAERIRSELIWRTLRSGLQEVVGTGPFPPIDKPGVVGFTILAGLAGSTATNVNQVTKDLAAKVLGAEGTQAEELRVQLVRLALARHPDFSGADFPTRVLEVTHPLQTPPFRGRVAIGQVYEAFGEAYSDAGELPDFKERLVKAARDRRIDLSSLDLPEYMSRDLREQSTTQWGEDQMHFVVSEWK